MHQTLTIIPLLFMQSLRVTPIETLLTNKPMCGRGQHQTLHPIHVHLNGTWFIISFTGHHCLHDNHTNPSHHSLKPSSQWPIISWAVIVRTVGDDTARIADTVHKGVHYLLLQRQEQYHRDLTQGKYHHEYFYQYIIIAQNNPFTQMDFYHQIFTSRL